jgi:hypothetical protein
MPSEAWMREPGLSPIWMIGAVAGLTSRWLASAPGA